ncbi:unnamed protein product [Caenorhabditis angaria]|uniref:Uncharacterized protein n=1 Tax=Caenorhabditis angaria TaxID=860376 RepID=A0A9P1N3K7_9PELO|nr:unnamed protein product [Caenorhabditis angaria]
MPPKTRQPASKRRIDAVFEQEALFEQESAKHQNVPPHAVLQSLRNGQPLPKKATNGIHSGVQNTKVIENEVEAEDVHEMDIDNAYKDIAELSLIGNLAQNRRKALKQAQEQIIEEGASSSTYPHDPIQNMIVPSAGNPMQVTRHETDENMPLYDQSMPNRKSTSVLESEEFGQILTQHSIAPSVQNGRVILNQFGLNSCYHPNSGPFDTIKIEENVANRLNASLRLDCQEVMRIVENSTGITQTLALSHLGLVEVVSWMLSKLQKLESRKTKIAPILTKHSLNLALIQSTTFRLPNGKCYEIFVHMGNGEQSTEMYCGKVLDCIGCSLIRDVFNFLLEKYPADLIEVMTTVTKTTNVEWVPISDADCLDVFHRAVVEGARAHDHAYVTTGVLKSNMRSSLYALLDQERGRIRKAAGGAALLQSRKEKLLAIQLSTATTQALATSDASQEG